MNQFSLDFSALARRADPDTSHRAAAGTDGFRARHEGRIFGALHEAGERGMTYREIAGATGMEPVAVARRLKAMERRGVIRRAPLSDCSGFESRDGMAIWWRA